MSKKDFKPPSAMAFLTPNGDSSQEVHGTLDTQEVRSTHPTQGRKGQKLQRINMAFSDENIEYLRIISRAKGVSMTQYVNDLLDIDRNNNTDTIKKVKELFNIKL